MEQKLHELKSNESEEYKEELAEYYQFVKNSVDDGSYFKDAMDWYMSKYVSPMVDRVLMIAVAIVASVSLYFLYQIISTAFPLVEKVPIVIRDYDTSLYRPIISRIKDEKDKNIKTVDESVAKYLLVNYIKERESYDFREAKADQVKEKFTKIKNNSSFAEYKNFQLFMSRDNYDSPINNFGKNIYQTVNIKSFDFNRTESMSRYEKLKWLFVKKIPSKAEVMFETVTYKVDKDGNKFVETENFLAKIKFAFGGLNREAKSGILSFVVDEYKLFRVK